MTIREFAKLCGVSPATISRYFSGQGTIGEEMRRRIEKEAKKTGYHPPDSYRSRRKNNATLVVLLPHLRHTFFTDILEELRQQAEKFHKKLAFLIMDEHTPQNTLSLIQTLAPAGILLLHESTEDPIADVLGKQNIPIVVCGALAAGRRFSSVCIDDMMATYDGMNYLIELGHRDIGVIADNSRAISSGFQRITGCKKAMEDARLDFPESNIVHGGLTFDAGYQGAQTLLRRAPQLSAMFAFSDDAAAGAIAFLQDAGKDVPGDISVLGFDDNSLAEKLRPRLTTVHQPLSLIAQKSIERLLEIQGAHDMASFTLSCEITERQSCRRILRKP